jgi:hypothetical protein
MDCAREQAADDAGKSQRESNDAHTQFQSLRADERQDRIDGAMNSGPTGSVMVS